MPIKTQEAGQYITRGSTLIYHSNRKFAPGRTFTAMTPLRLSAADLNSLGDYLQLLFPINAIFDWGYFTIPSLHCQGKESAKQIPH